MAQTAFLLHLVGVHLSPRYCVQPVIPMRTEPDVVVHQPDLQVVECAGAGAGFVPPAAGWRAEGRGAAAQWNAGEGEGGRTRSVRPGGISSGERAWLATIRGIGLGLCVARTTP